MLITPPEVDNNNLFISTADPNHTTGSGSCVDKINNCHEYGHSSCTGIYASWANENCANYCSYCGCKHLSNITKDEVGIYASWANENCANYCSYCGGKHLSDFSLKTKNN